MERLRHPLTVTIGVIQYQMLVEYGYIPAKDPTGDPTEKEDSRLIFYYFEKCSAWNMETNKNYFVQDPRELYMIKDWVNWEDEFNMAIL